MGRAGGLVGRQRRVRWWARRGWRRRVASSVGYWPAGVVGQVGWWARWGGKPGGRRAMDLWSKEFSSPVKLRI